MTTPRHDDGTERDLPPLSGDFWPAAPPPRRPWYASAALYAAGLLVLHVLNPLVWVRELPAWWFPPAGLGLVLVAWFGPRVVWLVALDVLLVAAQARLIDASDRWGEGWPSYAGPVWDALLLAAEVLTAWGLYRRVARGSRRLGDPASAMLFVLAVPTLTAGVFAVAHALPRWLLDPEGRPPLGQLFGGFWLSHALGFLVVAPPLLVLLTPWLERKRLTRGAPPLGPRELESQRRLRPGDWLEIATLTLGMAFLGLLQGFLHLHKQDLRVQGGWQLWSIPLLVIVWVSLHHGLRGGTAVASSFAGFQLALFGFVRRDRDIDPDVFWQVNLLGQCASALLVAAAANWIRLSEARYREVVTRIPVVLYSARVKRPPGDGRAPPLAELTFVSPAARSLFDAEPFELLGDYRVWLSRVHPEDQEVLLAAMVQLGQQRKPVTCEYRLAAPAEGLASDSDLRMQALPPDAESRPLRPPLSSRADPLRTALKAAYGSRVIAFGRPPQRPRFVRDTLAPLFGPSGELLGWDGVVSDITEQRALADDLRRTTSMFHALVANLPAGVFFVQGDEGLPILVNARARQLLGRHEDPAAGVDRLVRAYRLCRADGSEYPTDELPVVAALRHGVISMRDDVVVHRPDGRNLPLIAWAAPVDLGGRGRHDAAVWVFEDLSAVRAAEERQRQLEKELERSQRLELIGRLASGIAHDFNNLLTVVLTLARLAQDSLPPEHEARNDLRRIAYAGEQATNLAHQLLAFSKNHRPLPARIDVNRVARRTLELLRATLPKFVRIEPELADGELPVQADEMQVQQVLMNLCLNARDAMPKGGRLVVRTTLDRGHNGHARPDGWVRLSVEDEGEGIPEDVRARMFDAFFSTKERGTGLGLAMVRQIVEGSGGRIEVSSRVGEGARFDVWLPAAA